MNELLTQFRAEDDQPLLGNCLRAQAEALCSLGERARADEQYETLIGRVPSFAWGGIGLADCCWLGPEPKEYARAEAIYQRALAGAVGGKSGLDRGRDLEQCLRH